MGAAWTPWVLLIGRIIVGFGIGIAAMAVPMYIAELAPADMRGKLVVVNNMFITGGQFIATVIDGAFSYLGLNVGWRSVTQLVLFKKYGVISLMTVSPRSHPLNYNIVWVIFIYVNLCFTVRCLKVVHMNQEGRRACGRG